MHIFHVFFSSQKGGVEQAFINLTRALLHHGHAVSVLAHPKATYLATITAPILTYSPCGMYDMWTAWRIRLLLKKQRPELIIAHNSRAVQLMIRAARGLNIPVIAVSHSSKAKRMLGADTLVALTDDMRKGFIKAGYAPEQVAVIPNLIELPRPPVEKPRNIPPVIGSIGRLVPEKGFDALLEALAIAKQSGHVFKLRIAGDGPLRAELVTQAKQLELDVIWDGWVHDNAAFYHAIDIACLPSSYEPFGLTVLEALTYGVPVITGNAAGPLSIITHGKNGLVATCGNHAELASHVMRLLSDPQLCRTLSQAGWLRAQDFSFEHISAQWNALVTAQR